MFTRKVECEARVGKREELTNRVTSDVLPILQQQPGFVDLIALSDDAQPEHMVYLSFWKSKQDAQQYHGEKYEQIVKMIKPLLTDVPIVQNLRVEVSTSHQIAPSKAA